MFDLIFICDANSSVGFGHASRCANIAKQLLDLSKNIKIGFIGNEGASSTKASKSHDNSAQINKSHQNILIWMHKGSKKKNDRHFSRSEENDP